MDNLNTKNSPSVSIVYWALALIFSLIAVRLISLGLYPLYDTTEARYGEMARIMLETNNWVTPQFDYNVPFWGKPPFQTWASAFSFSWLGVNEFSARLPHFLCGLITGYLVFSFTKSLANTRAAIFSLLVLSSCLGFIIAVGMVMTDSALLMAYTLAMVSYWQCYRKNDKVFNGHLFFVALALGMLIKGPVAVVLIVISLVCWSLWQGVFWRAINSLPWVTGTLLCLLVTLPWYIWAELRTPGFLEYFILGEHVQRFLVSGWQGDLYGTAHVKPRGMIWLYWLVCACPWSFVALGLIAKHVRGNKQPKGKNDYTGINQYLLCWLISPLLLFTLAGNILPTYVLPGFSALAVLVALNGQLSKLSNYLAFASLAFVILIVGILSLGFVSERSESELLGSNPDASQIYYWQKRPFSAQFYSKGQAQLVTNQETLTNLAKAQQQVFIAMEHSEYNPLKELLTGCPIAKESKNRLLLKCH